MRQLSAFDLQSLMQTGQNVANTAQQAQAFTSPQFLNTVNQKTDQVIGDVEMYVYVQLGLQVMVSAATFGIFLIALYRLIKDNEKNGRSGFPRIE
jgi:hypothetical protein